MHAKQYTNYDRIEIQRRTIILVLRDFIMSSYDPIALCSSAAQILALSAPDTKTKTAMKCTGFRSIDEEYNAYRKRIERLTNKLKASHPSQLTVQEESLASTSSLSTETAETDTLSQTSNSAVLNRVSIEL